jgi:hypothetical protein
MTTLTARAADHRVGTGRASLAWMTVRQHRIACLLLAIVFAFFAIRVLVSGIDLHGQYAVYQRHDCVIRLNAICGRLLGTATDWIAGYGGLVVLPGLIGVFLGAPLVARQFETGSYRFSRTQGVSGARQLVVSLAVLGAAVVIVSCLLGLLAMWALAPWHRIARSYGTGLDYWWPDYFNITAMTFPAFALLDFFLGVAVGAAIRRVVPAIAVALACVVAVAVFGTGFAAVQSQDTLTGRLLAIAPAVMRASPVVGQQGNLAGISHGVPAWAGRVREVPSYPDGTPGPADSWQVSGWFSGPGGARMSAPAAQAMLNRIPVQVAQVPRRLDAWLAAQNYGYWIRYQPARRYWLFQALEAAVLLALALTAGFAAVRLSARRS